ncbi:MAG TPA: hypothetical protein VGK26_13140 [Thermoanaerobaculia bacterium]
MTRKPGLAAVSLSLVALAVAFFAAPTVAAQGLGWPQWGRTPQHVASSPVRAQSAQLILAEILYDPFVEAMKADNDDELMAHYAVPLVDDSGDVYMAFKTGTYSGFGNWDTITWTVRRLHRSDSGFDPVWTFVSDWKPEPLDFTGWEPVFQPAISGHDLYVPGLGGTVFRVDTATGVSEGRVNPFATIDPNTFVAGGLAVAPDGAVIYDAIALSGTEHSAVGAWLVRVEPEGGASRVDFATLVPGAPAATDPCEGTFSRDDLPWPPTPTAVPPTFPCGSQRPGINVVPAIAPDGTIYTLSRANFIERYAYLVAVHPDLTPAWSASLRGILNDGCGVLVPIDDTNTGCRIGAAVGVDPATNNRPAGRVSDLGTSSPVVLPDGTILVGTETTYNYARGHLLQFNGAGSVLATYDFGWDITPAVFPHGGSYSILVKDNHYFGPTGTSGRFEITSLSPELQPEWSFPSTQTLDCARDPSGTMLCVDDGEHPEGFEWCVNQPAVDASGVTFAGSEDGFLYSVDKSGAQRRALFLDTALGAAYTPVSIGPDGAIYIQNNGILFAVGMESFVPAPRTPPARTPESPASTRTVVR